MLKSLILLIISTTSIDPGCNELYSKRCPNPPSKKEIICKKDYEECDGFEGCTDTKSPYLCSNGECSKNFYLCKEKYFTCDTSKDTKCIDGLCREDCSLIRYSSCKFDLPIRCPDGQCVENDVECASPRCPADQPFMCPDSQCKGSFFMCEYPQNVRIIKNMDKMTRDELEVIYLYDQRNVHVMVLQVEDQLHMQVRGVTLSDVENSVLDYDEIYDPVFNEFFLAKGKELKPFQFIRSAIVKIVAYEDVQENRKPIVLEMEMDYLFSDSMFYKHNRKFLYCLGVLRDNNMWKCLSSYESNSMSKRLNFKIREDGIFAIIFSPSLESEVFTEEVYCGLVCKDKRLTFLFIFIGLPCLIILMYIFYKIYSKKLQESNINTKKIFVEKKMKEIENVNVDFKGQTIFEKLDEGVQYFVNPIRNEDTENLNNIKMLNAKLEKLKNEKKRLHNLKKKKLYNNKDKIEEIRKLRSEIDRMEDEDDD